MKRYILTVVVSASLVVPVQAFDLRGWFNSWSQDSKNALYVGTAASIVAGFSFLAYMMCFKKKSKVVASKDASVGSAPAVPASSELQSLTEKNRSLAEENRELAADRDKELLAREYVETQRSNTKNKVKALKEQLDTLKADHAQDVAAIKSELEQGQKDIEASVVELLKETQASLRYDQDRRAIRWAESLSERDMNVVIEALTTGIYTELNASHHELLKLWPKSMREKALDKLQRRKNAIEKRKKKAQERQANSARKKEELREAEAKVSAAMDQALESQQNGKRNRPAVAVPVTRKA